MNPVATSSIETIIVTARHLRPSIRPPSILHVSSQHRAIVPAGQSSIWPRMRVLSLPGSTISIDPPTPSSQWLDQEYSDDLKGITN